MQTKTQHREVATFSGSKLVQGEKGEFQRPEQAVGKQSWRTQRLGSGNQNFGSGLLAAGS